MSDSWRGAAHANQLRYLLCYQTTGSRVLRPLPGRCDGSLGYVAPVSRVRGSGFSGAWLRSLGCVARVSR
eukprot:1057456-Prorocentrum_minimum.AAC.1